jgi:hypothetical protein
MAQNVQRNVQHDDKFARESFTFRRMAPWQLWGISLASVAIVVAGLLYAMTLGDVSGLR